MITSTCPHCRQAFNHDEDQGEGMYLCPYCGRTIDIGNAVTTAESTSPPRQWFPTPPAPVSPPVASHSAFQGDVPFLLQWKEGFVGAVSAILGVLAGLAVALYIHRALPAESVLGRMFKFGDLQTLVPVSISCMFFWAVTLCLLRWLRLRATRDACNPEFLDVANQRLLSADPRTLEQDLAVPFTECSPLLRRLKAVVQQWLLGPSLQDADLILQQHIAHDSDMVHKGYTLIRTFVWALPVLGLIGTVIGISLAVGGFAQFLGGDVNDVTKIKASLVGVTSGLSFAFMITLLGLLSSLVVMLIASALQAREERLYAVVQQGITDRFLPILQRVAPETSAMATGEPAVLREGLLKIARDVMGAVGERGEEWSAAFRGEGKVLLARVAQGCEAFGGRLQIEGERLGDRIAGFQESLGTSISGLQDALTRQADQFAALSNDLKEEMQKALESQSQAAHAATATLAALAKEMQIAVSQHHELQEVVRALQQSGLDRTMSAVAETLRSQAQATESASASVSGLVESTRRILAGQAVLTESMQKLHDSGFGQTLTAVGKSLEHASRVLESFRKPIVFQAVSLDGEVVDKVRS